MVLKKISLWKNIVIGIFILNFMNHCSSGIGFALFFSLVIDSLWSFSKDTGLSSDNFTIGLY